jgi:hypothetical protein
MNGTVIIYHKHPASARTQFIRFSHGSVVGPKKLPALTHLSEDTGACDYQNSERVVQSIEDYFEIESEGLCVDDEFKGAIETSSGVSPVYLLRIKSMDPPFDKVTAKDAKFIALTEARGLPDFELLLLQKAYKAIMEG